MICRERPSLRNEMEDLTADMNLDPWISAPVLIALSLKAREDGLEEDFDFSFLGPGVADDRSDKGLVVGSKSWFSRPVLGNWYRPPYSIYSRLAQLQSQALVCCTSLTPN